MINYFYTAFTAVTVAAILAVWSIALCIKRATTHRPEVKPDFFQRDLFAVFGFILVCLFAFMGV